MDWSVSKFLTMGIRPMIRAAALIGVALFATAASATPLSLIQGPPDISTGFVSVDYVAGIDLFTAVGEATALDIDGLAPPDHPISSGSWSISATIDDSGNPGPGTLTISGDVLSESGLLLSGDLVAFGYLDAGGETFEFLFDVTGGDLEPLFGSRVGVILNAWNSGFGGSFGTNFGNDGFSGFADTFSQVVPEPSAFVLASIGAAMACIRRRRARQCA